MEGWRTPAEKQQREYVHIHASMAAAASTYTQLSVSSGTKITFSLRFRQRFAAGRLLTYCVTFAQAVCYLLSLYPASQKQDALLLPITSP